MVKVFGDRHRVKTLIALHSQMASLSDLYQTSGSLHFCKSCAELVNQALMTVTS